MTYNSQRIIRRLLNTQSCLQVYLDWKTSSFFPMMSAHKIKITTLSGDLLLLFLLGHIFASVSFSHLNSLSLLSSQKCSLICATNLYTSFCSSDYASSIPYNSLTGKPRKKSRINCNTVNHRAVEVQLWSFCESFGPFGRGQAQWDSQQKGLKAFFNTGRLVLLTVAPLQLPFIQHYSEATFRSQILAVMKNKTVL